MRCEALFSQASRLDQRFKSVTTRDFFQKVGHVTLIILASLSAGHIHGGVYVNNVIALIIAS